MKKQNWWDIYPEVVPSPADRPRLLLPGPGGIVPGPAVAPQAGTPYGAFGPDHSSPGPFDPTYFSGGDREMGGLSDNYPGQAAPSDDGQSAFGGDRGGPVLDRAAAIQHAADAIQRGADPDVVHARLVQMGRRDQEPPSPFSDLIQKGRAGMMRDTALLPTQAQPALDDQFGLKPRAVAARYVQDRLGKPSQRLDPRLAPQKAGDLQKSSQGAGNPSSTTFFTYGLPTFPNNSWARPRDPAGHAFPLPNDHPLPNPSRVEGDDIVVTGPRRAVREAMQQAAQHSSELREVARLIASGEGNYESYNSGTLHNTVIHSSVNSPPGTVTGRTINEILSTDSLPPTDSRRMHVVGRYEISHPNLAGAVSEMGLTGNERLTPELQDRIFAEYLIPHTPGLADFIFRGRGSVDDAQYAASQVWASIAVPQGRRTKRNQVSNGRMTYFDNTGRANRANEDATNALRSYLMNLRR